MTTRNLRNLRSKTKPSMSNGNGGKGAKNIAASSLAFKLVSGDIQADLEAITKDWHRKGRQFDQSRGERIPVTVHRGQLE